jgi:hypothetical protein
MPWIELRAWVELALRRRRERDVAEVNARNRAEYERKKQRQGG